MSEGRDRLRELLDAVLEGTDVPVHATHCRLGEMADGVFSSPYHFNRVLSRAAGGPGRGAADEPAHGADGRP